MRRQILFPLLVAEDPNTAWTCSSWSKPLYLPVGMPSSLVDCTQCGRLQLMEQLVLCRRFPRSVLLEFSRAMMNRLEKRTENQSSSEAVFEARQLKYNP